MYGTVRRDVGFYTASVPHHCGAEEAENLADRIRDRTSAAAGKEQTHRARVRRHVFDHQRSRVTAVQKLTAIVGNHDLARERFCECRAARAFVIVGNADRRIQARDRAARQTGCPATLLHGLIDCRRNRRTRNGSDLEDRAIGSHHS